MHHDLLKITLVLVTERREREDDLPHSASRDLDMTTPCQADLIRNALDNVVREVIEVNDIDIFINNINKYRNFLVLPHWNGSRSRNRTSLISSICEAANVPYIGADTYVRVIANDKSLSKIFLDHAGIPRPKSYYVGIPEHAELIRLLTPPLIIKPNMEGSSIGIDQNSVNTNHDSAIEYTLTQLDIFPEGIIVEEYIQGAEVSILATCKNKKIDKWAVVETYALEDEDLFKNNVYDYRAKFTEELTTALRPFAQPPASLLDNLNKLIRILGRVDYLRLDCRVNNGNYS